MQNSIHSDSSTVDYDFILPEIEHLKEKKVKLIICNMNKGDELIDLRLKLYKSKVYD